MGTIHELILSHGRTEARQMVEPDDRRLVDLAATVMGAEPSISVTYSGFCLTSLPHTRLADDQRWEKVGLRVRLIVEPGVLPSGQATTRVYGVPFGSRARLILLYLQTQALRGDTPEVELGASMRDWMRRMGVPVGGRSYQDVRDQANRISACNLTFIWDTDRGARFDKDTIVKGGIQLYECDDDSQPRLWVDTVRLSDTFFRALRKHPVPVSEPAIREIANQSHALDAYIWLAYRLHILERPTSVTWAALHAQFGAAYKHVRHFKPRFYETLKTALAVYPEAAVDISDVGIVMHPSPPPIPERRLVVGR